MESPFQTGQEPWMDVFHEGPFNQPPGCPFGYRYHDMNGHDLPVLEIIENKFSSEMILVDNRQNNTKTQGSGFE
ncbi:hypothetical protein [Melghirimyces profundicolus]|uniref:hypothetical protein n=1 Tax=Melghirimyces profundicolus TaxID=1242148 RepID=UPI000D3DBEB4|nr:hypothetical protein [Melghirimyces profundicolus]